MSSGKGRKRRRQGRKNPASAAALSSEGYGSPEEMRREHEIRERLHPSLRGMKPDDEINVILTTGEEVPPGAGDYLGTLDVSQRSSDGTVIPAGARVYRDLTPGAGGNRIVLSDLASEPGTVVPEIIHPGASGHVIHGDPEGSGKGRQQDIPAAFRRPDRPLPASMASGSNQVFGELGGGTRLPTGPQTDAERDAILHMAKPGIPASRENAAALGVHGNRQRIDAARDPDAAEEAFATMLALMLEEAEPGLAERMAGGLGPEELQRLAPVIAQAARQARERLGELEASDDRSRELIAGRDPSLLIRDGAEAEAVPVRTSWTADRVLDTHAWLARGYTSPGRDLGDYLARLIRTAQLQSEDTDKTALMFWPVGLGLGAAGPEEGASLARVIGHGLREARTYQVTGPMVARMRDVFRKVGTGIRYLDGGELPGHAGFAWMDQPWLIMEASGYVMPFRAISWEKITVTAGDKRAGGRVVSLDAARIIMWTLIEDDIAFGRWDDEQRAHRAASRVGSLTPQHVSVIPFDRRFAVNAGFEEQGSAMLALIHILWAFLGMELDKSRPVPPSSPHTGRRARKSLNHEPGVHVITLRRVHYISDDLPVHRDINRTCRWWTEDFYRHIDRYDDEDVEGRRRRHEAVPAHRTGAHPRSDDHDICAVCLANDQTVRITMVRGHFRGPSWLPVKPRSDENKTLYRLTR